MAEVDGIQKFHSVSSAIRQEGRSISTFSGKKRHCINLDKYLVGRPYQLFKGSIRSPATLIFYNRNLYYFCDFVEKSAEQFVEHHGVFKKVKEKRKPNVKGVQELQRFVQNYGRGLQRLQNALKLP